MVVAIVGMCGSGKSVATDIFENELGYKKVYFGGVTMEKLKEAIKEELTVELKEEIVQMIKDEMKQPNKKKK